MALCSTAPWPRGLRVGSMCSGILGFRVKKGLRFRFAGSRLRGVGFRSSGLVFWMWGAGVGLKLEVLGLNQCGFVLYALDDAQFESRPSYARPYYSGWLHGSISLSLRAWS